MKKRIFMVSLLTTILMLVFFSSALAKRPTVEIIELHQGEPDTECDGFTLDFEEDLKARLTTFYDKDDNAVRFTAHVEFDGTITNTRTETVMRSYAKIFFTDDLTGGKSAFDTGVHYQLIAPNKGVVAIIAGKVIFDATGGVVSIKGVQHPPLDAFCGALKDI